MSILKTTSITTAQDLEPAEQRLGGGWFSNLNLEEYWRGHGFFPFMTHII
mgnify:CR=1 FL=1